MSLWLQNLYIHTDAPDINMLFLGCILMNPVDCCPLSTGPHQMFHYTDILLDY